VQEVAKSSPNVIPQNGVWYYCRHPSVHCREKFQTVIGETRYKYEKMSEAKSTEVSEVLAPKCSNNNKEMKDTEVTVGIGNSNTSCD